MAFVFQNDFKLIKVVIFYDQNDFKFLKSLFSKHMKMIYVELFLSILNSDFRESLKYFYCSCGYMKNFFVTVN